jgi:predicted nucleotidyltransferase
VAELDIQGILEALAAEGVEFLLIGGVAVGFHGYVRATKGVDVVPAPEPENLERLAKALQELGAEVEGAEEFDDADLPDPLDPGALALGGNWVLGTRLGRIDVMQSLGGASLWQRLSPNAVSTEIGNLTIWLVGYEDLVALKEEAGRLEDLADLRRLRQARNEDS